MFLTAAVSRLERQASEQFAPCLRASGLLAAVPCDMMQTAPCESECKDRLRMSANRGSK